MDIDNFKTSEEKLEECGWKKDGGDEDGAVFKKQIGNAEVRVYYLRKDELAEAHIVFGHLYTTTADELAAIANELKKLEEK
jgi:hypothetical protein